MNNVIEVSHLTKSYRHTIKAVDDLSFDVHEGEILGLLGPNGSGKSTTINCILSLLSYEGGEIKIFHETMRPDSYDLKAKIGVVFQDVAVFEELTVQENINYFCGLYVNDRTLRRQYVEEAIQFAELENYRKFYPKQLSGGLLRRLNIACGIAHKPKLLFADEATASVDPQSRSQILNSIDQLRKQGTTVIYTTHYMEEVEQICDRVLIIDKGKKLAAGTIDELKEHSGIHEKISIELRENDERHVEELRQLPDVLEIRRSGAALILSFQEGSNHLADLMDYLQSNHLHYDKIYSERPTLNDVFLELTGKELRD
ncbi:ABC transporter ATP-binding protein [Catenisphaera adipataccumulans]|jgi:ABC-2 type transport system ATP-binding protein|uniref:ABC-2 type transport system ATP-binding protein n=1 Tax=Catenisphaera adipataccumulans TaxID=700500 RepID=A0A7W8FWG0_9FIRM|nr:ABC transporter ATP-binding protein [Catenisphaera adipataccumulans]MBB5183221.1 ABC-2 type transport system ATP-binding protein [Catenisphaera adipataccumulans]